jgi:hypothetical protein
MAYTGTIRFIMENQKEGLVNETVVGDAEPTAYKIVKADFSAYAVDHVITYTYNGISALNDGRDITVTNYV